MCIIYSNLFFLFIYSFSKTIIFLGLIINYSVDGFTSPIYCRPPTPNTDSPGCICKGRTGTIGEGANCAVGIGPVPGTCFDIERTISPCSCNNIKGRVISTEEFCKIN